MGSYQWYLTEKRDQLITRAKEIAWREHRDLSEVIEELLQKWVEKVEKTHNPQTAIEDYEDPRFRALPNIWILEKPGDLKDFSNETLKTIMQHAASVAYMAESRLKARGQIHLREARGE